MSEAVQDKSVAELYEDTAREFDVKARRETSPMMRAHYVGRAREARQRASEWRRFGKRVSTQEAAS